MDFEATISSDHPARSPRAFIQGLDFLALYDAIGSVESRAGRAAMELNIVLSLARGKRERLTEAHDVYLWICGGVKINHRRLSNSHSGRVDLLDHRLTRRVAVFKEQDLGNASIRNAHTISYTD